MKKQLLFIACLGYSIFANSQVVTKTIHFDNYQSATDNDLKNSFYEGKGFTQVASGGITGGAITCPDNAFLNDEFSYVKALNNFVGANYKVAISFKYNSALINTSQFSRAVGIDLEYPEYIYVALQNDKILNISSYNWIASNEGKAPTLTMIDNNWYKLEVTVSIVGGANNELNIKGEVWNLGSNGLATPVSVGISEGTISYDKYVNSTKVRVSAWGTRFGGSSVLDDFSIQGQFKALKDYEFTLYSPYTSDSYGYLSAMINGDPLGNAGGDFALQLSDNTGSFANPVTLIKQTTTSNVSFSDNLPDDLPTSSEYKVRVVTSSPKDTSNSSEAFAINAKATAIELSSNSEIMKVYPNPSTGIITLKNELHGSQVKIYNPYGVAVYEGYGKDEEIDLSNYGKGMYFLEIKSEEDIYIKRVVIE